jgi:hypothetical protein
VGTIVVSIIMMASAITFLSRGKIEVGSGREVRGAPLLFVSFFLILPFPIWVTASFTEVEKAQKQAVPANVYIKQNERRMALEKYCVFAGCLLLAGMFTVIGARPIEDFRREERIRTSASIQPDLDDHLRRFGGDSEAGEEQGEAAERPLVLGGGDFGNVSVFVDAATLWRALAPRLTTRRRRLAECRCCQIALSRFVLQRIQVPDRESALESVLQFEIGIKHLIELMTALTRGIDLGEDLPRPHDSMYLHNLREGLRGTRTSFLPSLVLDAALNVVDGAPNAMDQVFSRLDAATDIESVSILKDIAGPVDGHMAQEWSPSWRTANVRDLARTIQTERVYERLPILADALMDAGCADENILHHCHSNEAVHGPGCWVVDGLLGLS